MKQLLAVLLLVSVSFSSLLWDFTTDGEVSIKPVVYQNDIVVASNDGNVYALNSGTGAKRWQAAVDKEPIDLFIFDNALVVPTTSETLIKIGQGGKTSWEVDFNITDYNVSTIYGAAANANDIFVTADNGIYRVTKSGAVDKILGFGAGEILSPPAAGTGFVIFGKGKNLIKLSDKGQVLWNASIDESFWLSKPVIDGSFVYVGALDNRMHAYSVSNGLSLWEVTARNWVLSTPEVSNNRVYFGSNDGTVYSVEGGTVRWETETQLAVKTQPESGLIGGQQVIFVGGEDRNIYAISKENGDILWKGSAAGAVGSPLYYQNRVIFGSADSKVYAYSTERACSITNPLEGDVIGLKEVVVEGNYVSESGGATVWVTVGQDWQEAETGETNWVYYIDPKQSFSSGLNSISCMVIDAGGQESGDKFTTVTINHNPNAPLSDLIVRVSPNIIMGKEFAVYVNDGDDGSPVERFSWKLDDGPENEGSGNFSLTIPDEGTYKITVSKIGFKDRTRTVQVNPSGMPIHYLVIGILLIVIIIWQVWSRFLGARFKR